MKKIAIIGSSGLIGLKLSEFLKKKKFEIVNLQRNKSNDLNTVQWKLGESLPYKVLQADIFIYCAYDNSANSQKIKLYNDINYIGFKKLLNDIRKKKKYEIYFLSSQTSQEFSKSYYGKLKFTSEKLLQYDKNDNIEISIRPGIVYSKEKSYITNLIKKFSKFKLFPYFSNKKIIQPIHIDDLCECIFKIIEQNNKLRNYNLATKVPINIRDYVKYICLENNIPIPVFLYLPYYSMLSISILLDTFKLTRFSLRERIDGLVQLPYLDVENSLQNLNYELMHTFLNQK